MKRQRLMRLKIKNENDDESGDVEIENVNDKNDDKSCDEIAI